jgi:hypothetical protein
MPNERKLTMNQLIDVIERISKDPTYVKDRLALMDIVYLIANHVKLMGDIKTARDFLTKQQAVASAQPQAKGAYPDVTDVMKGK